MKTVLDGGLILNLPPNFVRSMLMGIVIFPFSTFPGGEPFVNLASTVYLFFFIGYLAIYLNLVIQIIKSHPQSGPSHFCDAAGRVHGNPLFRNKDYSVLECFIVPGFYVTTFRLIK